MHSDHSRALKNRMPGLLLQALFLAVGLSAFLFVSSFVTEARANSVSKSGSITAARAPASCADTITFSDATTVTNFDQWVDLSSGKIVNGGHG